MRDFFIRSLEVVINIVVVIMAIAIVIFAGIIAFGHGMGPNGEGGGPIAGLAMLIGGTIYLILMAGFMYLGLGIYQNTKRTADLLEQQARH
ncbi:MAG: hypothetical protein KGH84_05395 [Paracoccaceae bacterium]|nr:hypothetical protein [Paracoccaceae bacterium]